MTMAACRQVRKALLEQQRQPPCSRRLAAHCSPSNATRSAGTNVTYVFSIEQGGNPFDLVLTLQTLSGDADL